jgi:3-oxoadipate enol-lactonase
MFLEIDGHQLATSWCGGADRTFVGHGGWVGSSELWHEPFQLMQSSWRCISYDHRGCGISVFPASSISAEALVDDLFRVLDHYEVGRCVLSGESLGGLTCLSAVLRDPTRFDGLVLIDSAPRADPNGVKGLAAGARHDFPATVHSFVDACIPDASRQHLRHWGRQILLRAEPEAAARMMEAFLDVSPDLAQVDVPTLVVHGSDDLIIPIEAAKALASGISGAELAVINDAGHVPTITRAPELVAEIERWYAGVHPT